MPRFPEETRRRFISPRILHCYWTGWSLTFDCCCLCWSAAAVQLVGGTTPSVVPLSEGRRGSLLICESLISLLLVLMSQRPLVISQCCFTRDWFIRWLLSYVTCRDYCEPVQVVNLADADKERVRKGEKNCSGRLNKLSFDIHRFERIWGCACTFCWTFLKFWIEKSFFDKFWRL